MSDDAFRPHLVGLERAMAALVSPPPAGGAPSGAVSAAVETLPEGLPDEGLGELECLERLAPIVLGGARRLGAETAFAHMDPPTPWITWATTLWNSSLNQNLLHPDVAPVARGLEEKVVQWLAPAFGMDGGHMTPGSTVANLTALWAARELRGVRVVVASEGAHLSVAKAAHLLGLQHIAVPCDGEGRLDPARLPGDLSQAALVLTAGTTSAGAVDPLLGLCGRAAWTHVDAAWAGPLVFSRRHAGRLAGIEAADSVAVSAHKWLFQPKEAGLILFRDAASAHEAVSFGGAYLAVPNVGVLGSHGAAAVPLLATLLAWGRKGLAARIDRSMANADALWERLKAHPGVRVFGPQASGVVLWRPQGGDGGVDVLSVKATLPPGSVSTTKVAGEDWLRHVAANPNVDVEALWSAISAALAGGGGRSSAALAAPSPRL